jgi:thiol-disulfide isomerase/thioredoxin
MGTDIITEIDGGVGGFLKFLSNNPGVIIVKFGATWCGPCKLISGQSHSFMNEMLTKFPDTVICCDIDVDDHFELYATLKQKKMVNGIPAILCWHMGNVTLIPDDSTIGADIDQIKQLFLRCASNANRL